MDPTPTIAEDTTDKITERYLYLYNNAITDNTSNDKNDEKKNSDVKHFCSKCKSYSLTFEGLSISEGKQIQLINCNVCSYEWQAWILPNWFWLKSTSPDNHWTSDRWDLK